jgi:hypothetical protein
MSSSHVELGTASTPAGDHKFNGEFGFAQRKSADEEKAGSFATQTIIVVYCFPKSGLTAEVLSNVFIQLVTHTSCVVEQPVNPLARQQLCAQAWANVVMGVVDAPQAPLVPAAPPVALVPPVPPVAPVVPPLPQAQTEETTLNTRTNDPTLFSMLSLLEIQASPSRHSSQEAFPGGLV